MEILYVYGVSKEIVDTVNLLCKDALAQLMTPDGETDLFEVIAGILQGIVLSPFSSLLCQIMHFRKLQGIHQSVLCQVQGNLQYSLLRQILLIILPCFQTIWNNLVQRLGISGETIRLEINCKNTECMILHSCKSRLFHF